MDRCWKAYAFLFMLLTGATTALGAAAVGTTTPSPGGKIELTYAQGVMSGWHVKGTVTPLPGYQPVGLVQIIAFGKTPKGPNESPQYHSGQIPLMKPVAGVYNFDVSLGLKIPGDYEIYAMVEIQKTTGKTAKFRINTTPAKTVTVP